jgi:hypothetical protein
MFRVLTNKLPSIHNASMNTYKRHRLPPEIISNPWPIFLAGLYKTSL